MSCPVGNQIHRRSLKTKFLGLSLSNASLVICFLTCEIKMSSLEAFLCDSPKLTLVDSTKPVGVPTPVVAIAYPVNFFIAAACIKVCWANWNSYDILTFPCCNFGILEKAILVMFKCGFSTRIASTVPCARLPTTCSKNLHCVPYTFDFIEKVEYNLLDLWCYTRWDFHHWRHIHFPRLGLIQGHSTDCSQTRQDWSRFFFSTPKARDQTYPLTKLAPNTKEREIIDI